MNQPLLKLFQSLLVLVIFFTNPLVHPAQAAASPFDRTTQSGPLAPYQLFFPMVIDVTAYSITGVVIDSQGYPIPGITVTLSNGLKSISDSQGMYLFTNLPAGTYTYSASGGGYLFSPLQRTAGLPPDLNGKNFTGFATSPVSLNMAPYFHSQRTETHLENACGPASLLMTLDYFGLNPGSLDQVIFATSLPPKNGGFDPACIRNPVCLSAGVLTYVAQTQFHLNAEAHEDWTFTSLYAALAVGHPVIALATYGLSPDRPGHFVVVYGADPIKQIVYYNDPYDGPALSATWTRFNISWTGPVDVNDPIQPAGHRRWGVALSK